MSSGERTAQSQSDSATRGLTGHVACCMLHVAFRMLHVAWCPAHVACYMLYVAWCPLHVARCMLHVVCCMLQAACCTVSTACCTLRYWLCRCGARTGMRRSTSTRTTSCGTQVGAREALTRGSRQRASCTIALGRHATNSVRLGAHNGHTRHRQPAAANPHWTTRSNAESRHPWLVCTRHSCSGL